MSETVHIVANARRPRGWAGPTEPCIEVAWLPVIGPSSWCMWSKLTRLLDRYPSGVSVDLVELAIALGLGRGRGNQSPVHRTLRRLERFGLLSTESARVLRVRTVLPPAASVRALTRHPSVRRPVPTSDLSQAAGSSFSIARSS